MECVWTEAAKFALSCQTILSPVKIDTIRDLTAGSQFQPVFPAKPPVAITRLHTDATMNNSRIQNSPLRIIPAVAYCCSQLNPNCKFITEPVWLMQLRKYMFFHLKQMAQEHQTMALSAQKWHLHFFFYWCFSLILIWMTFIFSEIRGSPSGSRLSGVNQVLAEH